MMIKGKLLAIGIASFIACTALATTSGQAATKKWTITERQVVLRKKVASGLKSNELTAKEAKKLSDELDGIQSDIDKMKSKNDGQLSYKDEGKIEKRLNSVSLGLDKYELQKRVTAR